MKKKKKTLNKSKSIIHFKQTADKMLTVTLQQLELRGLVDVQKINQQILYIYTHTYN